MVHQGNLAWTRLARFGLISHSGTNAFLCLQVGLRKLLDAEGEVNVMKQELIALQPKLIETGAHSVLGPTTAAASKHPAGQLARHSKGMSLPLALPLSSAIVVVSTAIFIYLQQALLQAEHAI
jgi:hypothetical protein